MRLARAQHADGPIWVGEVDGAWHPVEDPYAAFAEGSDPGVVGEALVEPRLLAPCTPTVIAGMAQNQGLVDHPLPVQAWLKSPRTVVADGVPVTVRRDAGRVVVEAELALVVGREVFQATPEEAMDAVLGYTAVDDLSYPDRAAIDQRNFESKGGVGSTPLGPWIETGPVGDVPIAMRVDGEQVVDTTSGALPVSPAECLAYVSHWMPLGPGDVIMTGAPFSNATATAGSRVEIEVGGVRLVTDLR